MVYYTGYCEVRSVRTAIGKNLELQKPYEISILGREAVKIQGSNLFAVIKKLDIPRMIVHISGPLEEEVKEG